MPSSATNIPLKQRCSCTLCELITRREVLHQTSHWLESDHIYREMHTSVCARGVRLSFPINRRGLTSVVGGSRATPPQSPIAATTKANLARTRRASNKSRVSLSTRGQWEEDTDNFILERVHYCGNVARSPHISIVHPLAQSARAITCREETRRRHLSHTPPCARVSYVTRTPIASVRHRPPASLSNFLLWTLWE